MVLTEEEEAAMRPKIGDRKVTEDELDTIVSSEICVDKSSFLPIDGKEASSSCSSGLLSVRAESISRVKESRD